MITVDHLSKSFGTVKAVDDLTFTIKPGEIVGFLGPNGAGKTTTMRLITGFLSPDNGTVTVNDLPVAQNSTLTQAQIGYLPENNPLYKDMLVSELLTLSAELKNIPPDNITEAYDFAVKSAGLADVYNRPIGQLSKGYKQRVGLALALLHKPPIIIMDEPTEGLDPNQRTEIRSLIKKLAHDHTIIMSTHVMQEASAVCNRLIIISKGKLVADGTPKELTRKATADRILILELSGTGIETSLKKLKGVADLEIKKLKNRVSAKITVSPNFELQPEISRLARVHDWVIWRLYEEEQKLEEVFHTLTSEDISNND